MIKELPAANLFAELIVRHPGASWARGLAEYQRQGAEDGEKKRRQDQQPPQAVAPHIAPPVSAAAGGGDPCPLCRSPMQTAVDDDRLRQCDQCGYSLDWSQVVADAARPDRRRPFEIRGRKVVLVEIISATPPCAWYADSIGEIAAVVWWGKDWVLASDYERGHRHPWRNIYYQDARRVDPATIGRGPDL